MDKNNLLSSSAYLLFYRRRSAQPLGGDLYNKIEQHAEQRVLKHQQATASLNLLSQRDSSVPLASAPSSASDDSNETRQEPPLYVPFSGPGRQLGHGGVQRVPASNPFDGATNTTWTLPAADADDSDEEWHENADT